MFEKFQDKDLDQKTVFAANLFIGRLLLGTGINAVNPIIARICLVAMRYASSCAMGPGKVRHAQPKESPSAKVALLA